MLRFAELRAREALRGALHRVHAARRRPGVGRRTRCCRTPRSWRSSRREYELVPLGRERHGTARRYAFADGRGEIGFISPVSEPFCGDCNRIRLTAEGMLRTCLFSLHETDLRAPLRVGRERRRARGDRPRRGLAQGAQAPRRRARLPPAAALDVAHRRVSPARDRRGLGAGGGAALRAAAGRDACRSTAALGRVAAEDARSAVDLPPFDRSAMDGYAVRAADTDPPAPLRDRRASSPPATSRASALAPGTALGITTGAALPAGRRRDPARRGRARRRRPRHAGRPGRAGHARALPRRGRRAAAHVLAPAGDRARRPARDRARLGRRRRRAPSTGAPVVHVLATGHRAARGRRAARAGPDPRVQPADAAAARRARRRRGRPPPGRARRRRGDARRGRGGAGRRRARRVRRRLGRPARPRQAGAARSAGVEEVFWRVRLKPGKPMWFGRRGATLVFGLPGNPLSTVACFLLFVGPALRRLQGEAGAAPRLRARRGSPCPPRPPTGARRCSPPRLERGADGVLEATPTEGQGSHLTGALAASDGFVVIPHDARRARRGRARATRCWSEGARASSRGGYGSLCDPKPPQTPGSPSSRRVREASSRAVSSIALGVDGSAIKRRVRAGRLHPLHRGVYAVGHRVVGTDGTRWAAVLACGADAALGFASAAAAWEIRRQGGSAIHVVVGRGGRDGRRGIRLHRVRPLAAGELTTLRGLPITTPARTIADLAASGLRERALERAVDQAERTRLLDFADLHALLERYPSRPGSPLLRTVLARYRPRDTRSELEELLDELCTARGLPRPLVNTVVEGKVRDFAWPRRAARRGGGLVRVASLAHRVERRPRARRRADARRLAHAPVHVAAGDRAAPIRRGGAARSAPSRACAGSRREPGTRLDGALSASASAAWRTGPQAIPLPSSTRFQTRTSTSASSSVDEVVEQPLDDLEVGRVTRVGRRLRPPRSAPRRWRGGRRAGSRAAPGRPPRRARPAASRRRARAAARRRGRTCAGARP